MTPTVYYGMTPDDGNKGCVMRVIPLIVLIIVMLLLSVLVSGCRTSKEYRSEKTSFVSDSVRVSSEKDKVIDSLYKVIIKNDSIERERSEFESEYRKTFSKDTTIIRDSVFSKEYADGSRLEQHYHEKSTISIVHDTLYIYRDKSEKSFESRDNSVVSASVHDSVSVHSDSTCTAKESNKETVKEKKTTVTTLRTYIKSVIIALAVILLLTFIVKNRDKIRKFINL